MKDFKIKKGDNTVIRQLVDDTTLKKKTAKKHFDIFEYE